MATFPTAVAATAVSLLTANKPKPTQIIRTIGGIAVPIVLDATTKETYTSSGEMTKHPVEKGSDVTDNFITHPNGLQISGMIVRWPLPGALQGLIQAAGATAASTVGAALGPFAAAAGGAAGAIGGQSVAALLGVGAKEHALKDVQKEFTALRDAKVPVDILTGLTKYKSYMLTDFTATRGDKDGEKILVELTFGEYIVVESQTTSVAIPKIPGGIAGQNLGKQSKLTPTDSQATQGSSVLFKIFGGG